jgi:hypothetical protein
MTIIELTGLTGKVIYINSDCIGHIYEVPEAKDKYGHIDKPKYTVVGVTTHNNGGFQVSETPQQIMDKMTKTVPLYND